MNAIRLSAWVAMALTWGLPLAAHADGGAAPDPAPVATSTIGTGVAQGAKGVLAINEAAGAGNDQSNQGVIVWGAGLSVGAVGNRQTAQIGSTQGAAQSAIEGTAFSGVTGLVQVNQTSGSGNLQHNTTAIVGGGVAEVKIASDTALSGAISKGGQAGQNMISGPSLSASISPDAFRDAAGIVQVNQSAGVGNITANVFVLRPPAGTSF